MVAAPVDLYVAAFVARCAHLRAPGQAIVDEPGVHGLAPSRAHRHARLLVTDDRAYDVLSAALAEARSGMISVCAPAVRCTGLLNGHPTWRSAAATAMICRDLQAVPAPSLPDGLTLAAVRRRADDDPGGVELTRAVAAAARADPAIADPDGLAEYLRALPPAFSLLAAVDRAGVVRATAGAGTFGVTASVIFVNTDPDWRRRGIAQSMTAAALHAAGRSGARHAGLDASDSGVPLYRRLGFTAVTPIGRFRRVA